MSKRFEFTEMYLSGLYRIKRKPIKDGRGSFTRYFCVEEFKEIGFNQLITQINSSVTNTKGTIRGLHFQYPPYTETKIVTCTLGSVFDVVVDIRRNSPTFLQWHGEILNAENQYALYIPDGFAHGFQTMTDDCHLLYLHSNYYSPDAEGGINVFDKMIGIDWPHDVFNISERDKGHPMLDSAYKGLDVS